MWYTAHLAAYDVLDRVHVVLTVHGQEHKDEPASEIARIARTFNGEGEDDPWQWARDVLVAVLEAL